MSTKDFKFCFQFADVTINKFYGVLYKIIDEQDPENPIPPIVQGTFYPDANGWLTCNIAGNPGDYFYIAISAESYLKNGKGSSITVGKEGYFVEYLAIFRWEDNFIYVTPMSTVACVYTFLQRTKIILNDFIQITGEKDFREVAFAMKGNLYETVGGVSNVISSSPNATETNSYSVFNFLSNLLYYSITDSALLEDFIDCVNYIPGTKVTSCLEALIGVALYPFEKVQQIYDLIATKTQIYTPSLPQLAALGLNPVPDQWTLAVKFNNSGSENFLIAGTAFTVFDKENKAWVTNNFRQGTDKSAMHCLVFNPDGRPADISPITGGGILGAGFGVAVSPNGETIAFGNYGWGTPDFNPARGSISVFNYKGEVLCPPNGYTEGITRVQGMYYDRKGNLWMASWGSQDPMADPTAKGNYNVTSNPSAIVCYIGGNHENMLSYSNFNNFPSEFNGTFAMAIDPADDSVIVSNAGGSGVVGSAVYRIQIAADQKSLQCTGSWQSDYQGKNPVPNFEEFRQPQIDSQGNIYVGGIVSSRVVRLDKNFKKTGEFTNKIYGPWGITIDKKDKKFICGFGLVDPKNPTEGPFGITVIESGDTNWANPHLMTLPTAGDPVLLANYQPLYGNGLDQNGNPMPKSYHPLMRVTATSIDRAGNLWCANNWKPSLYIDAESPAANPGGDGIVIFIGVAEPIDSVPGA